MTTFANVARSRWNTMQCLSKNSRDEVQSLTELAEKIRAEHDAVVRTANDVLGHVLAAGRALMIAQKSVAKGQWADWVNRSCEVSHRTARRYIQLTRAYEASGHGVARDLAGLSLRGLMRTFTPSKDPDKSHERRRSSPSPASQDKLNSLAWANASPTERAHFISAIGWQALAEAIPANWRPIIEQWLQARLIVIEHGGDLSPPDDLSIPSVLNRAQNFVSCRGNEKGRRTYPASSGTSVMSKQDVDLVAETTLPSAAGAGVLRNRSRPISQIEAAPNKRCNP